MFVRQGLLIIVVLCGIANWDAALGQPKGEAPENPEEFPLLSLKFAGGTLPDYVKALREASPNFNIMMTVPEAGDIRLPAIQLDSVARTPALSLLQGTYQLEDGSTVKLFINDWGGPPGQPGTTVYKIWSERQDNKKPPAQVRVWNIGELLTADRKAEDVLTAVETAVGLLSFQEKAQIRYHAATTLLVASGKDMQLQTIDRVVDGLREGVEKARQSQSQSQLNALSELLASFEKSEHPSEHQLLQVMYSFLAGTQRLDARIQKVEESLQAKDRK